MAFQLKDLPYAKNALAPYISEETMDFHHSKHLQAYVNNTNNLIKGTEFENLKLEEIITKSKQGPIFNNSAQIWNHEFFWDIMTPNGGGKPSGNLLAAIEKDFNNFDGFKEQFVKAATSLFGSGWTWLVKNNDKLEIVSYSNAGNPLLDGKKALLGIDVWEHAYYIDYRNARPKYVEAFFDVINWNNVAKLF